MGSTTFQNAATVLRSGANSLGWKTYQMRLKDLIREQREAKGWTQRDLAEYLRVTHSAIAQWEAGKTMPKPANIVNMCSLFGIDANTFFTAGSPYNARILEDAEMIEFVDLLNRLSKEDRIFIRRIAISLASKPVEPKKS